MVKERKSLVCDHVGGCSEGQLLKRRLVRSAGLDLKGHLCNTSDYELSLT